MAEASWVEDPGESSPLIPFRRSEEQESRRKRDVEGYKSEPPPKQLSKTDIVPTTLEPPLRLLSLSTKGYGSVENNEAGPLAFAVAEGRMKATVIHGNSFFHYSSPQIDK